MANPTVSIVMPLYNAEEFLAEAIKSILAQTVRDWEFIIILDGCTDKTEQIVNQYADERFRIIKFESNRGIQVALNQGLELARSSFYARMDGDDTCEPTRLEKQLAFLNAHPDVDIVGTYLDYIDGDGKFLRGHYPFPTTPDSIRYGFREMNVIVHATIVARVEKIRASGGYDIELTVAQDLNLWLKCLSLNYNFANIPDILYHYRQHGSQNTRENRDKMFKFSNEAYRKYGKLIWGDNTPDIEFGAPFHRRAWRKIRRLVGRK